MEIYLIRHGACHNASAAFFSEEKQTMDTPLTDQGIRQAGLLAARLEAIGFDHIYASDLKRAVQTAQIINTKVNAGITQNAAFREIDMGDLYKKSWSDFPDLYMKWVRHEEDIAYPNGECGEDVWRRCQSEINEIKALGYKRIALVTHGGTIRSILCGALGIPQARRFCFGFPVDHCSVSVLIQNNEGCFLHKFNDCGALQAER